MLANVSQIRAVVLFAASFLNFLFAFLLWLRGKSKETFYLGWVSFFSSIYVFVWGGVFFFYSHKLLWVRATWLGSLIVASYLVFVYYFTGKIKYLKIKSFFWYALALVISFVSLATPYIIYKVSDNYPFICLETAGSLNQLARLYIIFGSAVGFYYLVASYFKSQGLKKQQLKYFIWGLFIYALGGFLFTGILPFFNYQKIFAYLDAPAYLSVFWIGLTTYAIFKKELFNIRIILTEFLVVLIGLILFVQIFLIGGIQAKIINSIIFILFCLVGYLLIKAVYQEIKREKEAQMFSEELGELNKTLEEKIQEKTKELQSSIKKLEESKGALMNILEDIDQTRKREEEEKNKTLAIITNLTDGLLFFDKNDKLLLANPPIEIFLGVEVDKILGKTTEQLGRISGFTPLYQFLEKNTEDISRKELRIKENLTLEISTIEVIKGEEKMGSLVILHDISREKLVERMKTEFVSLAAHQLRTPLSAIKWTLKMLLGGDLGKINKEQREFIGKTYNSNERMIHLINDLLNVTRIEEGRYLYRISEFSVEEIMDSVVDSLGEKIQTKKIKFTYNKPQKSLPKIRADREKIEIVIQNLIENAISYSLIGGPVTVSIDCDKLNLNFSVKDAGMGILEHQKPRLFTKFFRGENAAKMDTQGTGLGLFMAKNIIESHGGKIWFESKWGEGSTFCFSLPLGKNLKISSEVEQTSSGEKQPLIA
jgi:signal transduction histidine kinase